MQKDIILIYSLCTMVFENYFNILLQEIVKKHYMGVHEILALFRKCKHMGNNFVVVVYGVHSLLF